MLGCAIKYALHSSLSTTDNGEAKLFMDLVFRQIKYLIGGHGFFLPIAETLKCSIIDIGNLFFQINDLATSDG
jgi:hypothetical protein